MNFSKQLLIFSIILFLLSIEIPSVYSQEELNINTLRYLEEKGVVYNCSNVDCVLENTNCTTNDSQDSCQCKDEYASINVTGVPKCSLKRKKQLTAFLLELFVGFGAGHFYRKCYLMASLKLVAFVFGIYVICLFPLTAKCVTDCCDSDCLVVLVSIFFYLYAAGLATWYIFDLVYFGKNKYQDCSYEEKIDLLHW